MPKIFQPISARVTQICGQYLISLKVSPTTSLFKEDGTLYQSHTKNKFTSSFYQLTAMSPISSPLSDECTTPVMQKSSPFTSSPGLVSKYLDNCEADRCALATPTSVYESLGKYTNENNGKFMVSESSSFMSSPSAINRFLDECEIDRDCDSPFRMASPFQVLMTATAKRPKPFPRRTVLLGRQLH